MSSSWQLKHGQWNYFACSRKRIWSGVDGKTCAPCVVRNLPYKFCVFTRPLYRWHDTAAVFFGYGHSWVAGGVHARFPETSWLRLYCYIAIVFVRGHDKPMQSTWRNVKDELSVGGLLQTKLWSAATNICVRPIGWLVRKALCFFVRVRWFDPSPGSRFSERGEKGKRPYSFATENLKLPVYVVFDNQDFT